jgi:uncharacterized protein YecE (DUF72 family)
MKKHIHIGTSGWHYSHWQGPFYPDSLAKNEFLGFYSQYFHTAEINNTFYQLPQKKTFYHWKDTVPDGFIFSVKASRYITHMKKLCDPDQPLSKFLKRLMVLQNTLGPVLFQLPPRWKVNPDRLKSFLEALPKNQKFAFEFRDPSWFCDRVYHLLEQHDAAFCIYDLDRRLSPKEITADFIYVRLHGPNGPYQGKYEEQTLAGWAGAFSTWVKQNREVYCYFDNDEAGYAVRNAQRLQEMISKE